MRKAHHDPRGDYPRLLLAALAKLWWTPLDYSEEDFRRITAPVLILIGEEDQFIPLEEAQALAAKIPQAELALIPDAGHDDLVSREGVFIDLVLDFLERRAS